MFFDDYKQHADAQVRTSLLWEYDLARFDWQKMRTLVVQRVVERGRRDDFYAILNLYGLEGVREGIREIPTLNPKDRSFVCTTFHLKKEELKCLVELKRKAMFNDVSTLLEDIVPLNIIIDLKLRYNQYGGTLPKYTYAMLSKYTCKQVREEVLDLDARNRKI